VPPPYNALAHAGENGRNTIVLNREELMEQVEWLLSEGDCERAGVLCRTGLRRFPKDPDLWMLLGDSMMDAGRLPRAQRAYHTAWQLRRDWALPLSKEGEVLLMIGRGRHARRAIAEAYAIDANEPHPTFMRGVVSELEGRDQEADFWYRRALHLAPEQYFLPLRVDDERFDKEFRQALQQVREEGEDYAAALRHTRWLLLDRVDRSIPELRGISPLAFCYLIPREPPAPTPNGLEALPAIETGFLFRRNILRVCREPEDVYTEITIAICDELDAILAEYPDPED
jgi:tetratricopeptide (TPR) repeat protein